MQTELADTHISHPPAKFIAEDSIAVAQQVAPELVKGKLPLCAYAGAYLELVLALSG